MTPHFKKFISVLSELFMLDQAELDFGIYRILNQKRADIEQYLYNDLEPQVRELLQQNSQTGAETDKVELQKLETTLLSAGIDPETSPKVLELRAKLTGIADLSVLEGEVFSHLATFFRRYYEGGDFMSMRRYKKDVYAIPYEGEEVKLHWANADQYYIKTGEYFQNYTFKLADDRLVHFKLRDASTEQNNNKAQADQERRFKLADEDAVEVIGDELNIYFTYNPMPKGIKQKDLQTEAFQTLKSIVPAEFITQVLAPAPTESLRNRTLLEKHINDYVSRNSFDYFIHKDLGAFLRRELDFYLKNEVLFIDDINARRPEEFLQYLAQMKTIKAICDKLITFLAQLEDFQKKLWLKKKMVVETNYCITLDRVPRELYSQLIACDEQRAEWVRLFAIDEIRAEAPANNLFSGTSKTGYTVPLTEAFLLENPFLVLDTAFFTEQFKQQLLAGIDNIEEQLDGTLINSENFQALNLLQEKYKGEVKCIYTDPPYNTGNDDFVYKDNFQQSSWLTMMNDRLLIAKSFVKQEGTLSISIDLKEVDKTISLLDSVYGESNRKNAITVKRGSVTGAKVINPGVVNVSEYVLSYSLNDKMWKPEKAYREKDYDTRYGSIITNFEESFENWKFESVLDAFSKAKMIQKTKLKKELGENYDKELLEFVINFADKVIRLASLDENSISADAVELKKKSKKLPTTIFHLKREDKNDYYILNGSAILFYKDRLMNIGGKLVPAEPISDIWDDVLPNDLHNEGGVSLRKGKKPERLIHRIIEMSSKPNELVLDFFAGSATSCAVSQKSKRKWIGIELGNYFDNITLVRLKNTLFGDKSGVTNDTNWKGGGFFKYIRLEQYEDTLNNLIVQRPDGLNFTETNSYNEGYLLGYMLDVEARGSLFNLAWFERPFDVFLKTTRHNELKPTRVDLVETFNYLIGLRVRSTTYPKAGICVVDGTTRTGEKTLVIWRDCSLVDAQALNDFFTRSSYSTLDREFDRIYLNGDNLLQNIRKDDEHWKVVLIEEEFAKRMFEV